MGLASPRNIGIVAVIAVAGGFVPGVPGLVGGAPAEDAAAALPPAPEVVEVITDEPIGPDDGLIRLVVTPTSSASASAAAATPDTGEAPAERDRDEAPPASPVERGAGPLDSGDALRIPEGDDERIIDQDVLSALTDGAVLHLDRRQRPWAVFPDGTKVPLFPAGDGERILAERSDEGDDPGTPTDPVQATGQDTAAGTPGADADAMPAESVGHPVMDEIVALPGVRRVVALGDGSYAVTVEDASVLDGLAVDVVEDVAMGIGSEPYEGYQWALDNTGTNLNGVGANPLPAQQADADIDGIEARAEATGRGVVVAVVDSGVDFSHRDLAPARWTNDDENCTNGIDDDANGYVDDCHGWDFAYEDDTPFNPGAHAHGTHVAGIIAAAVDGYGVAGVAPDAEIMDLNVGAITASGQPGITMSAVARAIRYAVDNGADVINLSLGTSPGSPRAGSAAVESAILHAEAQGVLVVAAAGNDGVNLDAGPGWPAGYEMSNMITVGASTPSDTRASFSNWGAVVDIFAPGELILSTVPVEQNSWNFMSGTSQATPIVAATAALLLDDVPGLPPAEVRARLIAASDRQDALMAHVADGVRLNAATAVGVGSPDHRIADVAVRIGGLAGAGSEAPIEAVIDVAIPSDFGADDDYSWQASVYASLPDGVVALTGLDAAVDGISVRSDDVGSVDLGFDGSGTATLRTSLPEGAYALLLEAVPLDDPTQRLGDAKVASFTVGGAAPAGADGTGTSDATGGSGSSGSGSSGSDSSGPGSSEPGGSTGTGSTPTTSPSTGTGTPSSGSTGSTSPSTGTVEIVTGGSGGGGSGSTGPTGGAPSGGSQQVIVGGSGSSSAGGSTTTTTTTTTTTGGGGGTGSTTGGGSSSPAPPAPTPVDTGTWAIDALSPHYGPVGISTTVQLIGSFPSAAYVWFGDVPGTVLVASDRMMVVLAPAQATAGPVDVTLRRTGEGTVLAMPDGFTYVAGSGSSGSSGSTSPSGGAPAAGSGSAGEQTNGSGSSAGGPTGGSGSGTGGAGGGSTGGSGSGTGGAGGGSTGGSGSGTGGSGETSEGTGPGAGPAPSEESVDETTPARLDARTSRSRETGEVVDLGNGLRGVRIDGPSPLAGAPSCLADPCRI